MQQQFEYAYIYGAICPTTGETEALISSCVNKDMMTKHLQQISQKTDPERFAVVIMDGASWHQNDLTNSIENVSIIRLPPYSPELNPIEQVWAWLRQHHLANRCFRNYLDIVDACEVAWNDFISDVGRVKSMCYRKWINMARN